MSACKHAARGEGRLLLRGPLAAAPWLAGRGSLVCLLPLQDVQSKLKESAQCVGDEFMNCKLATRAKVLVWLWCGSPPSRP